jgi:hypothetical protein
LVIWIVDKEPVVDVLLETLGLVAWGNQGAGLSGSGALLNSGGLGQSLVVGLDTVDDDSPLAMGVDGSPGLDVGGDRGAEVGLLDNLLQSVHAVVGVGQHVLVDGLDTLVVVLKGGLYLIGGVLRVLNAPGLGVADGALGFMIWLRGVVRLGLMVGGRGVVDRLMIGGGVVHWFMVRGGVMDRFMVRGSMVDRLVIRSRCRGIGCWVDSVVDDWGGTIHSLRCVDRGGVVDRLHWAVHGGGGSVAVDSSMDRSRSHGNMGS